ncbi:MAG: hypothetical protein QM758_06560 [Armatimonas sp.]
MKQIFAKILCVAALLSAVSVANAAVYNFNVLRTAGGNTGWNVKLQTSDNITWNVLGIESLTGAQAATARASTIEFSFYDSGICTCQALMGSGSGHTNAVGLNGGLWTNGPSGPGTVDPFKFNTPLASRFLRPYGGATPATPGSGSTKFTGGFTLDNSIAAQYFTVSMQGPGFQNQWSTNLIAVTPEMPGGALLLAALLPVGFLARKRIGALAKVSAR